MRLLKLTATGFRSYQELSWEPGGLNLIIGANGSGKSNLLEALEFMASSARGELDRFVEHQGGIGVFPWDERESRFKLRIRTSPIDRDRDLERDSLTYDLELTRLGSGSGYRIESELLGNYYRVETGERTEPLKLLERSTRHAVLFDEQARALTPQENTNEGESLLSHARGPFPPNRLIASYQRTLGGWLIYREPHFDLGARARRPSAARRETRLSADGQNLISVLHTLCGEDRAFKKGLDAALRDSFGAAYEDILFPPVGENRIGLSIRWQGLERPQPISELAAGTVRFLALYVILAAPKPPALIAIDEPEVGLHPAMLPVFVDLAEKASERTQIILTTCSPHLLDAFVGSSAKITTLEWHEGKSKAATLTGQAVEDWLEEYSMGGSEAVEDKAEQGPKVARKEP